MPVNARLFSEHRWLEYFARLRAEDPIHFNETDIAGRFWSLTRYEDIKRVDIDWKNFSSAHGIVLGFPVGADLPEGMLNMSTFIAMDPPTHDVQRKTVAGSVSPSNLGNMEALIRERTCTVLDALPVGETFDWVETVSIELTTMMLATLFDFPFEDRRKLTRWSDITFAIPQPGGIIESAQQRRDELLECLEYFQRLKAERLENPGHDLVSMMAHGKDTKDLSPMEYLGNLLLLIVGGNDTTRNTMSGSVYALNQYPDEFTKLKANPDLIPQMVAEVIRWQTPLAYMRRTANHDIEIGGKQIKRMIKSSCGTPAGTATTRCLKTPIDLISSGRTLDSTCLSVLVFIAVWATASLNFSCASCGKNSYSVLTPLRCRRNQSERFHPLSTATPRCRLSLLADPEKDFELLEGRLFPSLETLGSFCGLVFPTFDAVIVRSSAKKMSTL